MKNALKWIVPVALRPAARKIFYFPFDTTELLLGKRDSLTPPTSRIFVGAGDFKQTGEKFFRYFVELAELEPGEKLLGVGCGIGRMALPLTKYLNEKGSYEGFDIVADGIHWCRTKITPRYPNFHFRLADVRSAQYNPNGSIRPANTSSPMTTNRSTSFS
jgi:hypothetical protein